MIMGFPHEYTYQDCEYRIRTMNTKHAQCICYTFVKSLFFIQAAHKIARSTYVCDQVGQAMVTSF